MTNRRDEVERIIRDGFADDSDHVVAMETVTRPIIGIENRTAQEVFDIMCDRFKASAMIDTAPFSGPLAGHWSTDEGAEMANRYSAKSRDQLAYGQKTDLELANAVFMADRGSLELIGLQRRHAPEHHRCRSFCSLCSREGGMNHTKRHGNADKPATHVVARARSASLREPFIGDRPPPSSKPAWHPKADVWAPLPGTTPVPLIDVTGCRWQVSTDGPALFCNAPRADGSWCKTHKILSKPKPIEARK